PKTPQGMNSRVGILGNYVYFRADDGNFGGKGLWRTGGSEAGTGLVARGMPSGTYATAGNRLYAGDGSIWVTDGTPQGSGLLTSSSGAAILNATRITAVGDRIFVFNGGLWVSD